MKYSNDLGIGLVLVETDRYEVSGFAFGQGGFQDQMVCWGHGFLGQYIGGEGDLLDGDVGGG